MQYKPEELLELQKVELEILKQIIRICEEEEIAYFTVGGTTLGAVRHKGFIPWDDDIDIGMMRDDYEKFIEVAPEKLGSGYVVQHFKTDPNTPAIFAKVRKEGTRFVEEWAKDMPIHHGIFVDVMPYDFIPEDEKLRSRHRRIASVWREIYHAKSMKKSCMQMGAVKIFVIGAVRHILNFLLKPISKDWLYKKADDCLRKYNDSGSSMVSSRAYSMFDCRYEDIFPLKQHPFEGIMVNVPANVHRVLEIQYGNYMRLPPEDKRITHSPVELKFQ